MRYGSYYRPAGPTMRYPKKTLPPVDAVEFQLADVWGAAARAFRINGGYFKEHVFEHVEGNQPRLVKTKNNELVRGYLEDTTQITDQDREQGLGVRDYLAKDYLMKTLKGAPLSSFELSAQKVTSMESFTNHNRLELAIIGSLFGSAERGRKQEAIQDRIDRAAPELGSVGDKVQLGLEVVKCIWSRNYGVYFVTGITKVGQAVFFSCRFEVQLGSEITVAGTIKARRDDATQLNRTKILSNLDKVAGKTVDQ